MVNTDYLQAELNIMRKDKSATLGEVCLITVIKDIVDRISEEVEEPKKHGRWQKMPRIPYSYQCSECSHLSVFHDEYCPHCGARMDGEEDERK